MSTPPSDPADRSQKLFRHRRGPRDFLLYQIETREAHDPDAVPAGQKDDDLAAAIKDLLVGESFLRSALEKMDVHLKFGVLAVRVDAAKGKDSGSPLSSPPENAPPAVQNDPAALLATAQALEQVCARHEAVWGRWDSTIFGCFVARADRNQCLDLAQTIRQNIALRNKGTTVSIGIALFPTVNFPRESMFANAQKALEHAAFFGPESTVPFDAVTLNVSGDQLYQQNDVVGAIRELKTALTIDPSNVNVHNSLGVCYAEKQAWDLAREAFETARWLDPEDTMAAYNLGLIHMLQDEPQEALEFFRSAVEIDDEMFEAYIQMGRLLLKAERAGEARSYLERAVELNPQTAPPHRFLGLCLEHLDQPQAAISAYRQAVKCNPHDAASLSALGFLLDQAGENLEITTLFCKQGVDLEPGDGLYRHRLGLLYLKGGRQSAALAQFEKAVELGHDSQAQIDALKPPPQPQAD